MLSKKWQRNDQHKEIFLGYEYRMVPNYNNFKFIKNEITLYVKIFHCEAAIEVYPLIIK
jgi:hypothetical protein